MVRRLVVAVSGHSIQGISVALNVRYRLERTFVQVECPHSTLKLPLSQNGLQRLLLTHTGSLGLIGKFGLVDPIADRSLDL